MGPGLKSEVVLSALLVAFAAACAPQPTPSGIAPPTGVVIRSIEIAAVSDIAWSQNKMVAIVDSVDAHRTAAVLVAPSTGVVTPIDVDDRGCDTISVLAPALDGETLSFVWVCYPDGQLINLEELNLLDGAQRSVVTDVGFPPNSYLATLDQPGWIAADASGLCAWVSRISGTGTPWPISVGDGPRPFLVDEGLTQDSCDRTGMASRLTRGPNGELAFLAAPDSVELSGDSRFNAHWFPYTVSEGEPRRIPFEMIRPTDFRWSPARDRFLISGTSEGRTGLWGVESSGRGELLFAENVIAFAEGPDRQIAVVVRPGAPGSPTELLVIK